MEFDIGNILYIVITLVAVTIGILGKKKKPSGTGGGKESAVPDFMENLERAFNLGGEEQFLTDLRVDEQDLPEEEPGPVYEQETEKPTLMEEYEKLLAGRTRAGGESILSRVDRTTESLEVFQFEEDKVTNYFEVIKDFDAGTAVVYSAIINRVDY